MKMEEEKEKGNTQQGDRVYMAVFHGITSIILILGNRRFGAKPPLSQPLRGWSRMAMSIPAAAAHPRTNAPTHPRLRDPYLLSCCGALLPPKQPQNSPKTVRTHRGSLAHLSPCLFLSSRYYYHLGTLCLLCAYGAEYRSLVLLCGVPFAASFDAATPPSPLAVLHCVLLSLSLSLSLFQARGLRAR